MRLKKFNNLTIPDNDAEDDLGVDFRSVLVNLPGGAFDPDAGRAWPERRKISRRFIVIGETEAQIDDQVNQILTELGKGRGLLTAVGRDGVTEFATWAKVSNIARQALVGTYECKQALAITWEQDYPYWLHKNDLWFLDDGEVFDGGLDLDGHYDTKAFTSSPASFTIQNNGGAIVPMLYITVEVGSGATISNLTMTNAANGLAMQYVGTMTAGDILTIDVLGKSAEVNGDSVIGDILLNDKQIEWMRLELGDNIITVNAAVSGGTVTMYWVWARHYL